MKASTTIWITWERQRRSLTLAACLGAKLHVPRYRWDHIRSRALRYLYLVPKTVAILVRERPSVCCCQNPSMVLAVVLGLLRPVLRYRFVVDRHSNFNLGGNRGLKWKLFHALSDLSLRMADLTIVTNEFLAEHVRSVGGRAFVLQDKLPPLNGGTIKVLPGTRNIVFVCGFGRDEPIEEVLEAAKTLDPSWRLHVTGNHSAHIKRLPALLAPPANVTFTGFLDDGDYQTLLRSADAILVLTRHDHTLTCGAYEAVALGKATVASDTEAMRSYFRDGFIFTRNSPDQIASALRRAVDERECLEARVRTLRRELEAAWQARFAELQKCISVADHAMSGDPQPDSHGYDLAAPRRFGTRQSADRSMTSMQGRRAKCE